MTDGGVTPLDFFLTPSLIAEDMESDPGWTVGATGDDATTGVWERGDPIGTGAQPENDHTPEPGVQCWFTGQGSPGGTIGENDVDGGKTSLVTSVMDVSAAADPVISYWAWYSNNQGSATDDEWLVEISNDGGASWVDLVRRATSTSGWEQFEHRIADFLAPTAAVQIRFVASDEGSGSIVEAAIDDFQIFGGSPATAAPSGPRTSALRLALHPNAPNPFASSTTIRFSLPTPAAVELNVFDVSGRLVRSLASDERREAGLHHVRWDGTDARGERVASGVYFYRVDALGQSAARRMVRLK